MSKLDSILAALNYTDSFGTKAPYLIRVLANIMDSGFSIISITRALINQIPIAGWLFLWLLIILRLGLIKDDFKKIYHRYKSLLLVFLISFNIQVILSYFAFKSDNTDILLNNLRLLGKLSCFLYFLISLVVIWQIYLLVRVINLGKIGKCAIIGK